MKRLIEISRANRERQQAHNAEHQITPRTIVRNQAPTITEVIGAGKPVKGRKLPADLAGTVIDFDDSGLDQNELADLRAELEREMYEAAEALEFERAAILRDQLKKLKKG